MAPIPIKPQQDSVKGSNAKTAPPLPLEQTLADIAAIKAAHVDLSHLLGPPVADAGAEEDVTLGASYEFVKNARAALAISKSDAIEREGTKMEKIRERMEEVVNGLQGRAD